MERGLASVKERPVVPPGKSAMPRIVATAAVLMTTNTLLLAILVLRIRVGFARMTAIGLGKVKEQCAVPGKPAMRRMAVSRVALMTTSTSAWAILVHRIPV